MSSAVFPTFIGQAYPNRKTPRWSTIQQNNTSGKQTRIGIWSYPKYLIKVDFNVLRSNLSYTEQQQLQGFFNSRNGAFDSFLWQDAHDNTVAAQGIGTGDGTTKTFQLVRAYGGFVEPVLAPNTVSAVYLAGVSIPTAGYSAPANGALSQTSAGALGATTYYVKSTWVTNSGETLPAAETNLAVAANKVLNVAAPGSAPAGAIGWNVYVSNTAGGGSGAETKQNGGTPIALGAAWVEPGSGLVAGSALPVANTTGWSVSTWGAASPGVLTFAGSVVNTIAITSDFTYYWPVHFLDDTMSFDEFMSLLYECKGVTFETIK